MLIAGRRKMMKKLVALLLVFGIASVSNAALTINVNEAMDTVSITGDGATGSPVEAYLLVDGPAHINGGTLVYAGSLSAYADLEAVADSLGMDPPTALATFADFVGMPNLQDLSYMNFADGSATPPPLEGLLVDGIALTDILGEATLNLVSGDFGTTYSSVVVPEPITIALLGLGGLFLRRRR